MSEIVENPGVGAGPGQSVTEVDLVERANVPTEAEKHMSVPNIEGLITFDQLVMNFLQQHHDTLEEYKKLSEALDNMHYTSTITKISLEELQQKKDHFHLLQEVERSQSNLKNSDQNLNLQNSLKPNRNYYFVYYNRKGHLLKIPLMIQ